MATREIHVDRFIDRMRYRCPHGRAGRAIEPTNNHWWCRSCARQVDQGASVSPEFYELHDQKTGDRLTRDEVELVGSEPITGVDLGK